jgi:hypothetical protein
MQRAAPERRSFVNARFNNGLKIPENSRFSGALLLAARIMPT